MSVLLGVNIDHVATLRQARGTSYPSVVEAAKIAMDARACGITMHLREDRRHIHDAALSAVLDVLVCPINMEMANSPDIFNIALELKPEEVCLVPEKREELTTEGGLDVIRFAEALKPTISALEENGTMVSLFIEPNSAIIRKSHELGASIVELHTGSYCDANEADRPALLAELQMGAKLAHELGLRVNAGHGINMQTLPEILDIPHLHTLNIGHSLIARSVVTGLDGAITEMMNLIEGESRV